MQYLKASRRRRVRALESRQQYNQQQRKRDSDEVVFDGGNTYCREERPVVDLAARAAAGVLPKLLDDRAEDELRRQETGSPQRPLHAGFGDVPDVEVIVVRKEGGQAQALLVDLSHERARPQRKTDRQLVA